LVSATSQSVHFERSLATRSDAEQRHLRICVCPLNWVGGKRTCCCSLARRTYPKAGCKYPVFSYQRENMLETANGIK